MNKKYIGILTSSVAAFSLLVAPLAFAAANPQGTGQPGAPNLACGTGNSIMQPTGFLTSGFIGAAAVYAGSPGTPIKPLVKNPVGCMIEFPVPHAKLGA